MLSKALFLEPLSEAIGLFDLSIDTSKILDIAKSKTPLGKQIEELFLVQLKASERYELICHNLQIQNEKITLGELDFIIRDTQLDEIIHIELVYKFYIHDEHEGGSSLNAWIGPNRRDRLVLKKNRLVEHQFPLLHHPATLPYLQKYGLNPQEIKQKLCFQAQLYVPKSFDKNQLLGLNPECICGLWYELEEFINLPHDNAGYFLPSKQEWTINEANSLDWIPKEEIVPIIENFHSNGYAPMIWKNEGKETLRMFILPKKEVAR